MFLIVIPAKAGIQLHLERPKAGPRLAPDKEVWGRPVGLTVAKDGSLFLTEDGNGTIWRINYSK